MKKIILIILLLITFLIPLNVEGFDINNDGSINILSSTKSFTYGDKTDTFIYDNNLLYLKENTNEFIIITPTNTNIIINPNNENKILSLNYVTPEASELSLKLIDDTYYVYYNDNILYGDFSFNVDGNEVNSLNAKGDNVSLIYNDTTITINNTPTRGLISDFIILIIGIIVILIVIAYIIYLFFPRNYHKELYKASKRLINYLNKNKNVKQVILNLRIKVTNLNTLFRGIKEEDPIYYSIKMNLNEINLTLDNVIKVNTLIKEEDKINLINYFKLRINNIITLLNNGNYKFKNNKKDQHKKIKIDLLKPKQLDKQEEDALHYLEGVNIIKK